MLTIDPGAALLTPDAMRTAEATAIAAGTPALRLMERAAAAAALAIDRFAPAPPVLVLCGPGNNGGDGYAIAALLRARGRSVRVAAYGPARGEPAATMATRWAGPVEALESAAPAPLIIDALFGTGLQRPLAAPVQAALDRLRDCGATVIAIDIASGIDALTGACAMSADSPLLSLRDNSPMIQLLASLAWPLAWAAVSKYAAMALFCVSVVASYSGRP
jgi:hydroxyethylthiazole kinase-like uncharacterized protein yjeF